MAELLDLEICLPSLLLMIRLVTAGWGQIGEIYRCKADCPPFLNAVGSLSDCHRPPTLNESITNQSPLIHDTERGRWKLVRPRFKILINIRPNFNELLLLIQKVQNPFKNTTSLLSFNVGPTSLSMASNKVFFWRFFDLTLYIYLRQICITWGLCVCGFCIKR